MRQEKAIIVIGSIVVAFLMVVFATVAQAASTVTFTWTANPVEEQVTEYRLYQSDTSGQYTYGSDHAVGIAYPGGEIISLSDVPDGTWYWVLTAVNSKGESGPSNEVTATLDTLDPPTPPTDLIISAIDKMMSALEDLREYFAQTNEQDGLKIKFE